MTKVVAVTKYGGSAKDGRDGFKLNLSVEANQSQLEALASIGLASLAYRGGASVLNKGLGAESNSAVEFREDLARTVEAALHDWAKNPEGSHGIKGGFALEVVASRHVHGEKAAPKFTDERAVMDRHEKAKDLEEFMKDKIGYAGALRDADGEWHPDALRAIRAFVKAM